MTGAIIQFGDNCSMELNSTPTGFQRKGHHLPWCEHFKKVVPRSLKKTSRVMNLTKALSGFKVSYLFSKGEAVAIRFYKRPVKWKNGFSAENKAQSPFFFIYTCKNHGTCQLKNCSLYWHIRTHTCVCTYSLQTPLRTVIFQRESLNIFPLKKSITNL